MHIARRTMIVAAASAVVASVLLVLVLNREQRVEEGRCKLIREKADPSGALMGLAYQYLMPLDGKPDGLQDLPAGFDRPCYYQIKSGSRLIPAVVNLSESPTLCLDTNGDGVLAGERCFTAKLVSHATIASRSWQFGPISLVSSDDPREAHGRFYVNCYRTETPGPLTTFPVSVRTGKLKLAGKTYRVAVVDGDCDGSFNSILSLPLDREWRLPASDVFAVDLNRNGKFRTSSPYARSEVMPLGRLVQIADAYYAIDIASDGTSLTLSRTHPQLGTLLIDANDAIVELKLWSDAADQYVPQGCQWQLPAGKYKAIYAMLAKADASGDVWTFSPRLSSAYTHLGPLEFFEIRPGETTSVRIGPPFVVKADVQKTGSRTVSIALVIMGCAGEVYSADFRRNGRRALQRAFKIMDKEGNVLVTDKFQYG